MNKKPKYIVLPKKQQEVADKLHRNFLIVLGLAFIGEVLLRLFPSFLKDVAERVWLEWLLVSLIGVCAYLLWNVAIWHSRPNADYIAFRPWYQATAARGPVIALVVMIALTNINFQVSIPETQDTAGEEIAVVMEEGEHDTTPQSTLDFGINFGEASDAVLLVSAFILGFYSRLANDVLGRIARFIFKDIYEETYKQELRKDYKKKDDKENEEGQEG